ncbi:GTP binding protein Cdc42 [Mycena haematopus]|nr:GTP binding protein Cdc42 [Mycena haematopus]
MNCVKCTLVGDDAVGKTCLLTSYADKKFPTEYVPTVFGGFAETVMVGNVPYVLGVYDTIDGNHDYQRLRPLSYPQTDVFLVCFSVGMPVSFANVKDKWFPEGEHYCPGVPRVIVATQIDLRTNLPLPKKEKTTQQQGKIDIITTAQGENLARELKAARYVECSAKTQEGVHGAFHTAIVAAVEYQQRPQTTGKHRKKIKCVVI